MEVKMTKDITLTAIDGSQVVLTLKTVLSEYDSEQLESVYLEHLTLGGDNKPKVSDLPGNLVYAYNDKSVDVVVEKWSVDGNKPTLVDIKKRFRNVEYKKLLKEINDILDKNKIKDEEKKETGKSITSGTPQTKP